MSAHLKLFSKYADGSLTAAEGKQLDTLLKNDETLRLEFLEYMNVCVALEDNAAYSDEEEEDSESIPFESETANPKPKVPFQGFLYAAAACIAATLTFWFLDSKAQDLDTDIKTLIAQNAQILGQSDNLDLQKGQGPNSFEIEQGWLRLKSPKGVVFNIYGPATGRFENPERLRLDTGRLKADVGEMGKGFTVTTKTAEIIDLGTQFGIEIDENANSKVAVYSGEVEVHSPQKHANPLLLTTGEGVQLESGRAAARLVSMAIPNEIEDQPFPQSLLSHISDNNDSIDFRRFYGILPQGMREGASAYTGFKSILWKPKKGEPFPPELQGAELVQTFHIDRNDTDIKIDLTLSDDSTVYVIFDERYETPQWLRNTFTDTGKTLQSGPWRPVKVVHDILPDSNGDFYVTYKIWSKNISSGKSVSLGASRGATEITSRRAMYGIAIKAQ